MKRLIGIVLGLMLMFGATITAEAETAPVAKVGDTEYTSYSAALSAWNNGANDGAVLTLLADVTATDVHSATELITGIKTLDLNGHSITRDTTKGVFRIGGGTFTLTDSKRNSSDPADKHRYYINNNGFGVVETSTNQASFESAYNAATKKGSFVGGYITGGNAQGNIDKSGGAKGGGAILVYDGNLIMNGGTLIGNQAVRGGSISVEKPNNVTINHGLIVGNVGGKAGGINVEVYSGTMTLALKNEAKIIDNRSNSNNLAGGVCMYYASKATAPTLDLSGSPQISGNTYGANRADNLYLTNGTKITFSGTLSDSAKIGITMQTPSIFTTNLSGKGGLSNFISDNTNYAVTLTSDGEAQLVPKYTVKYSGNGNTSGTVPVDSGSPYASGSTVNVLANTLTKDGYSFAGWKIGDGTTVYANSADNISGATGTFTISGNTTLTAQWKAIPATAPTISGVTGATLTYGYTDGSVSVTATPATDTTYNALTYQWYSNTINSNSGGTEISGATSESYAIPTGKTVADSPLYYYCVVTATRTDNSQTATATSDVATVTVKAVHSVTITAGSNMT